MAGKIDAARSKILDFLNRYDPVNNVAEQYSKNTDYETGPPASLTPGADYAQKLAAQSGDADTLASTLGLRMSGLQGVRRGAPVQSPDIFIGGAQQAQRPQFAPSPVPQGVSLPISPVRRSLI